MVNLENLEVIVRVDGVLLLRPKTPDFGYVWCCVGWPIENGDELDVDVIFQSNEELREIRAEFAVSDDPQQVMRRDYREGYWSS